MNQQEENWNRLNQEAKWWSEVNNIFNEITVKENRNFKPILPEDPEEKKYYIEKINYLMLHNEEKNRDSEGQKSYKILKEIILNLE